MSDYWICIIPKDPTFVPTEKNADAARDYLVDLAPRSDAVTSATAGSIQLRDCGGNLESITCPACSAPIEQDWWQKKMDADFDGAGFRLRRMVLPCCRKKATLNDLIYHFDQGFSRFVLDAMNPKIRKLKAEQIKHLAELLGTEVRVIYQRI